MKKVFPFLFIFIGVACSEKVSKADINHLNGYWEIEEVVFPDGAKKAYRANTTIDFFKVEGIQGYRKKVQPRLDGSYETSDDAEAFTILEANGVFSIYYKNNLSEWQERIEKISNTDLTVVNEENIRYHYKRFQSEAVE